ncbi:MAG: hypothetical protein ABI112_05175 [Terracoccus sp.]
MSNDIRPVLRWKHEMSARQSNLSASEFGYDLVVATTQKSINVALKQYLDAIVAEPVVVCYVFDEANNLTPIAYEKLKVNAKGSDPFDIADAGDPKTNQDLLNLAAANFAGGFRAKIGLPDMPPAELPAVVTLGSGVDAPVTFNLLSSDFRLSGFSYGPRGSVRWINRAQPPSAPWYFTSQVQLGNDTIDPHSPVPPAVQRKIQELLNSVGEGAFSIKKLFLDLDTVMLLAAPTIVGISPTDWPVWGLLSSVFIEAYINQLRHTGHPVLGYSCAVSKPEPATLPIRAISRQCCGLVDSAGLPILHPTKSQQEATTLNYLCTTSENRPVARPFTWNWVEPEQLGTFSGVQAVRRDVLIVHLQTVFNALVEPLAFTPSVGWAQAGSNQYVQLKVGVPSGGGAHFAAAAASAEPAGTGTAGGTTVLSLDFDKPATAAISPAGIGYVGDWFSCTVNYKLTGDVSLLVQDNAPCIRLRLQASCTDEFRHTEAWIAPYHDLPSNKYVDFALEVLFQLSVTADGKLVVSNATPKVTDTSVAWVFYKSGIYGLSKEYETYLLSRLNPMHEQIRSTVTASFADVSARLQTILNNAQSWVFPGSRTFVFGNVLFSDHLDFITHTTYAEPG